MHARSIWSASGLAASLFVAGSLACTSPAPVSTPESIADAQAAAERAWTKEFQQQSILIADVISIEGPPGLRSHLAMTQLPDQKYSAKTVDAGFLQEVSVAADAPNPIWIHIDNLAINALRNARVLERVSAGPVRIHASGDAMWKNLETGQEQRAETIDIVGPPAK